MQCKHQNFRKLMSVQANTFIKKFYKSIWNIVHDIAFIVFSPDGGMRNKK